MIYISPTLGEISEDTYDKFISLKSKEFNTFIKGMKSDLKYGILRSGVLVVETKFKDVEVSGTDIYNYLINFGFDENHAVDITKLFSTNNRLIERLVEDGFNLNDVVYGMDLKARLDALGLKSATTTKKYALEDSFIVHQLLEVEIEEPPPPPELITWHPFAISKHNMTYQSKKTQKERILEFFGIFWADKDKLYDELNISNEDEERGTITIGANKSTIIHAAEEMLIEYAETKGYLFVKTKEAYDSLFASYGLDLLTSEKDINIYEDEVPTLETTQTLEIFDTQFKRTSFSDKIILIGEWWMDKSYYILELRKQVMSSSR